jgi:DNA-binding PadR family transcriptional regulator
MASARELKGTRREVLLVLGDGRWWTTQEIAHARGVKVASIYGTVQRMHAEGWIEADTDPDPPTRGTQYRIADTGRRLLDVALAEEQPVGQVSDGQWLLLVEEHGFDDRRTLAFHQIMEDARLSGSLAWGAPLGWGWLLAFEPGVGKFQRDDLAIELGRAGFHCREAQPEVLYTGAGLREQAVAHTTKRTGVR